MQRCITLDMTRIMLADAAGITSFPDPQLECRFLSSDEVIQFATDPENDIEAQLAARLDLGYDFCFAALVNGELASYCWLALHSIEARHNRSTESDATGIAYSYPEDHAFRYKGFTHPQFRGRRIYERMSAAASVAMRQRGVRYIMSTAEVVNYGALKSSARCGYENIGMSLLLGIGDRVAVFASDLSDRGILVGRKAQVLDRQTLARPPQSARDLSIGKVRSHHQYEDSGVES